MWHWLALFFGVDSGDGNNAGYLAGPVPGPTSRTWAPLRRFCAATTVRCTAAGGSDGTRPRRGRRCAAATTPTGT